MIRRPPRSTLFPYTRSSDLGEVVLSLKRLDRIREVDPTSNTMTCEADRKSTRLNSSHGYISYAVFCLKKKKKQDEYALGGMQSDHLANDAIRCISRAHLLTD